MQAFAILAAALAVAHGSVSAADEIPEGTWSTSAELGAIATSGNTVGTSVTGKIDAHQELSNWSNQYTVSGYFKEDERTLEHGERIKERAAERYSLAAKAAFKLLEDGKKLFVLGSHVDDKFGAYTRFSTMAVGHSSRLYKSRGNSLDVEIGPGYFNGVRATGDTESGFTVRGAAALRWEVSPSAIFSQTVSVERGTSNMHSSAETALSTKINGTMQMKAAFVTRNDTNVPPEKKNTDTQTSLTLVYSF
jgi:putative salt-induced outer membrane protein